MALTGLRDDYRHDGRVLTEILQRRGEGGGNGSLLRLARLYEQINAPVGAFGLATVRAATAAINSGSAASDSRYVAFDPRLTALTDDRNALALAISELLESRSFRGADRGDGGRVAALIRQAQAILARAEGLGS